MESIDTIKFARVTSFVVKHLTFLVKFQLWENIIKYKNAFLNVLKGRIGYLVVDKTQLFGNEELCQEGMLYHSNLNIELQYVFQFYKGSFIMGGNVLNMSHFTICLFS